MVRHTTQKGVVVSKYGNHEILGADVEEEVVNKVVDVLVEDELVGPVLLADHLQQFVQRFESVADEGRD